MIDDVIHIDMSVTDSDDVTMDASDAVPVSTSDYDKLKNRPRINSITLEGDKKASDLSLQEAMEAILETDIDKIIYGM